MERFRLLAPCRMGRRRHRSGKALGLFSEHQGDVLGREVCLRVAVLRLGAQQPEIVVSVFLEILVDVLIDQHLHQMPVVQPGPLHGLVRNVKPQGLDQMESGPRAGAGAGDGPGVVGYLRFKENNVDHSCFPSDAANPSAPCLFYNGMS